MHKLLFFIRVSFICNGCFWATLLMRTGWGNIDMGWLTGLLIVLGTLGAYVTNGTLHFILFFLWISRREAFKILPTWLLWANGVSAIAQVLVLLFLGKRL